MMRLGFDIPEGKTPEKKPKKKKGKDKKKKIEPERPAEQRDMKELKKAHRRAEKRLVRARARVEQIESDLLLADEAEDIEDLKTEIEEARAKKDAAMKEWERTKRDIEEARDLAAAKAKEKAEEMFRDEDLPIAGPSELDLRVPKKKEVEEEEVPDEERPFKDDLEGIEVTEEFEEEEVPPPRKVKPKDEGFKWTARKAIVVGVLLFFILPIILYGFAIPRVDVTVKTWYFEGFQNTIVIDAKVQNDGTVDVNNLDLNITVMKVVGDNEIFITDLTYDHSQIGPRTEEKVDSVTFYDDQTDEYILLVQVSYDAGGKSIDESYTHYIDKPYMNMVFEDKVFEWGF